MSDLISRSALLEALVYCQGLGRKSCEAVAEVIKNQPTAYNPERVVGQLEEWSFETEIVIPGSDGYDDTENRKIICTQNAIDIVRAGGKE